MLWQRGCLAAGFALAASAAVCCSAQRCQTVVTGLSTSLLSRSAVPTIATAWQGVAEAESRRAGDAALAAYTETFKEDVSTAGGVMLL